MTFVVDASIVLTWLFEDESNSYADEVLEVLAHQPALAPVLLVLEVSNALVMAERRGRTKKADTIGALSKLLTLPIEFSETAATRIEPIVVLAQQYGLTIYDATYLDLALFKALPIASLDARLVACAKQLGIELFHPNQ